MAPVIGRAPTPAKSVNLNNPEVPWVGLVVSDARIDGYFSQGRVDFRR